ncbi:MAG: hypothetical protein EG823_02775 [Actinobacteria bacterium]|nr:hypothetical protein [Actinomycetota bacterium]
MRLKDWQRKLAFALLAAAVVLYAVRWSAFPGEPLHDEMARFLLGDMAFLFLHVLLVMLVLDGLIRRRERDEMRQKLDMVIGAFFSETGADLLGRIARSDARLGEVWAELVPSAKWTAADYERSQQVFWEHAPEIDLSACDLAGLGAALSACVSLEGLPPAHAEVSA